MKMKYMKIDLYAGEARATLDGQDAASKVWNPNGTPTPYKFRRQQDGRGIMF